MRRSGNIPVADGSTGCHMLSDTEIGRGTNDGRSWRWPPDKKCPWLVKRCEVREAEQAYVAGKRKHFFQLTGSSLDSHVPAGPAERQLGGSGCCWV